MDRRGGGAGNGGMRDYVDPWAHNGNSGSSPLMGTGGNGGPLSNFTLGNNVMGNMNMGGNNNGGPNSNNGGGSNGGGFANNNMDMDKTSTQVTIPKDVSYLTIWLICGDLTNFVTVGWCHHWQGRWPHPPNPLGIKCVHPD